MTAELDSTVALQRKLVFGVAATLVASALILWILIRIEVSNNNTDSVEAVPTSNDDLQLENEEQKSDGETETREKAPRRRRQLRWPQKALLVATVVTLVLLNYLLLVFIPSGMLWLNVLALLAVMGAFLRTQIIDEAFRRQRLDRLLAILTLILFIASFLSISTYARLGLQEGSIYRGPARIVGYDNENYSNQEGQVTRTDLEVAWGGSWACPENSETYCQAFVNGALCETTAEDDGDGDDGDGDDRRSLEDNGAGDNDQDANDNDGDNDGDANDGDNDAEDEMEEENEELEEDLEEEEEENEELEDENEELQDEIDYEEGSGYDDDYYGDDYWNYDWDTVWGDYACEDLFDADLEGQEYDADSPPGGDGDEWPFVMIYGSCKTCKAYLLDYYSTEHFSNIKSYQTQGRYYAYGGIVCLFITAIFAVKQYMAPAKEHEVELLNNEGGVVA